MKKMPSVADKSEIVIYTASDGTVQTEVRLQAETLWLTQSQLEELFATERTSLVKHIQNILDTGELEEEATCAKFAQVRQEGKRLVRRDILHYNLDMILSVGYRVNSKRGTQFRIWANRILKEHLVQGYTINQKRLQEQQKQIQKFKESIRIVERGLLDNIETIDQARSVIKVLSDFSQGLEILDKYDHESLETSGKTRVSAVVLQNRSFLMSFKPCVAILIPLCLENTKTTVSTARLAKCIKVLPVVTSIPPLSTKPRFSFTSLSKTILL